MKIDYEWLKASKELDEEWDAEELQFEIDNCDHDWEQVKPGILQCTYPKCQKEKEGWLEE